MKTGSWSLVALALAGFFPEARAEGPRGEFRWRHDLEPARSEALASGKPLLVVFR